MARVLCESRIRLQWHDSHGTSRLTLREKTVTIRCDLTRVTIRWRSKVISRLLLCQGTWWGDAAQLRCCRRTPIVRSRIVRRSQSRLLPRHLLKVAVHERTTRTSCLVIRRRVMLILKHCLLHQNICRTSRCNTILSANGLGRCLSGDLSHGFIARFLWCVRRCLCVCRCDLSVRVTLWWGPRYYGWLDEMATRRCRGCRMQWRMQRLSCAFLKR